MFDGLYAGFTGRRGSTTRAAIVLFSEGLDNTSRLEEPVVCKAAGESDVISHGAGLDDGFGSSSRTSSRRPAVES
jgi:hypothetical protein